MQSYKRQRRGLTTPPQTYMFMKQANPKKRTHRYCAKCNHEVQYERVLDYPFIVRSVMKICITLKRIEENEVSKSRCIQAHEV